MTTTIDVDSLVCAYNGTGWPTLSSEQKEALRSCPKNRYGRYYYQVPGGPVVHYRTGFGVKAAEQYYIVEINGFEVVAYVGDYRSSSFHVGVGKKKGRFFAQKEGMTLWMPEPFLPDPASLRLYRMFFVQGSAEDWKNATYEERVVLWAAALVQPGEAEFRKRIECLPVVVKGIAAGQVEGVTIDDAVKWMEEDFASYVRFMASVVAQVSKADGAISTNAPK
jgi:hypothetical protein